MFGDSYKQWWMVVLKQHLMDWWWWQNFLFVQQYMNINHANHSSMSCMHWFILGRLKCIFTLCGWRYDVDKNMDVQPIKIVMVLAHRTYLCEPRLWKQPLCYHNLGFKAHFKIQSIASKLNV